VLTAVAYNLCYSIDDIAPYYLSTWLVAAVFLAAALDTVLGRVPALGRAAIPAGLVSLVLLGLPIVRNWGACDLSRATWVREFARNKLENTDPGGVLISQLDPDTFPIWYVQDVLNVRPDVVSLDRAMFTGSWSNYDRDASLWYLHHLRGKDIRVPVRSPPVEASWEQKADDQRLIELLDGELRGRPLCMTYATTDPRQVQDRRAFLRWARDRHELLPQGIILRLQSKSQPVDLALLVRRNQRLWKHMRLPDLRGVRTDQDLDSDYVVQHYACMLVNFGGLNEMAGDQAGAEANYRRALALSPDYRPAASALASLRQAARTQSRLPSPVRSGSAPDRG
jgi:hypothetical protein